VPLRALAGESSVCAFEYDEVMWASLKQTYKANGLRMPCCESLAIPKTSKLGNHFFSHSRRGECTSAPESAEHIFLKTLIAKAAKNAGWSVTTEWPGETPEGDRWVADVFCENGKSRIALEVQFSYQTVQELRSRQQAYSNSNVRAAWFASSHKFKPDYLSPSKHVPFFYVLPFEVGNEPLVQGFNLPISEFVVGMLSKKLSWTGEPWIYGIHYLKDTCWKCRRGVKQVFGSSIDVYGESAKTVPNMSTVLSKFGEFISNEELKALGLNTIGKYEKLKGNAPGFPYCNVCIHCDAPQNNYYVMKKLEERGMSDGEFDSESPEIGMEEFVSPCESSKQWHYEK
jgi:hypothetical protein